MAEQAIPVTPEEDEAWDALAERLAEKVAAKLSEDRDERPLLNMKDVAERLDVSPKLVRDLVSWKGGRPPQLASIVVGNGARKVEPAALEAYIWERRAAHDADLARGPVVRSRNGRLTAPVDSGEDQAPEA